MRRSVAVALWKLGDSRGVELIVLKDSDAGVRREAAEGLGKIGTPAIESPISALKDQDEGVRRSAAVALKLLGWEPGN